MKSQIMQVSMIRYAVTLLFAIALLSCQLKLRHKTDSKENIPFEFEVKGSSGEVIRSEDMSRSSMVLIFFNVESVSAWRALSKMERTFQKYGRDRLSLLAIGRSRSTSAAENIADLEREFSILSPVIFDRDNRISKSFKVPDCCDYIYLYTPSNSQPLAVSYTQLDELARDLVYGRSKNADLPESDEETEAKALLAMLRSSGISLCQEKLTVLNLFSGMCEGCSTGNRLETLNALSSNFGDKLSVISLFSKGDFSHQDLENLRKIIRPNHETLLSEIDKSKIQLLNGHLLVVFDPTGKIVWMEKPGLSETAVYRSIESLAKKLR